MREEVSITKPARVDIPSFSDLRKKDNIYRMRDIKATTSPRGLYRHLRNTVDEMGYEILRDKIANIKKEEVGNTGSVSFYINGEKRTGSEKRTGGGYTLDFSGASDIEKYSLIGGVLLFLIGLAISGWICLIGFIAILGGILPMLKERPKTIEGKKIIWIKGEGEVYGGQLSESQGDRGMQQDQIVSELSVIIAGKPEIDLEGIDLEEIKKDVKEDVDQLTRKLDALIK